MTPTDCPDPRFGIEWRTAQAYEQMHHADPAGSCLMAVAGSPPARQGWDVMALFYYLEFWRRQMEGGA